MEKREIQSKKRYFLSFVIGTIMFLLVIGISYSIALYQYTRISDLQGVTAYSLFEKKTLYTFFGEDICSEENFAEVSKSLGYQGRILEDLENKFGKTNSQILERKKFYSVLLLEHLSYVNLYNENCTGHHNTILFFYSNTDNNDYSDKAGRVLDLVASKSDKVSVYSFDINLDSLTVQRLKEKYNVISAPTIVVNGNYKMVWPFSDSDLDNILR